jgi:hypothetical protein
MDGNGRQATSHVSEGEIAEVRALGVGFTGAPVRPADAIPMRSVSAPHVLNEAYDTRPSAFSRPDAHPLGIGTCC